MRTKILLLFLFVSMFASAQIPRINISNEESETVTKIKDSLFKNVNASIKLKEKELEEIKSFNHLETVKKELDKLYEEKKLLQKRFNKLRGNKWFPSLTLLEQDRATLYKSLYNNEYQKTSFVNSLSYLHGNNSDIVQSELVSDNIGAVLVSFGTTLNIENNNESNEIEEIDQDLERLLASGGNFYLNFEFPVYKNYNDIFTYLNQLQTRISADIEGFGNDIDTSNFNLAFGVINYFGLSSEGGKFNFFIQADSNVYFGTEDFMSNLDVDASLFFNTNVNLGIALDNKYGLFFRTNFASEPSLRTEKIAVGLQLIK